MTAFFVPTFAPFASDGSRVGKRAEDGAGADMGIVGAIIRYGLNCLQLNLIDLFG